MRGEVFMRSPEKVSRGEDVQLSLMDGSLRLLRAETARRPPDEEIEDGEMSGF